MATAERRDGREWKRIELQLDTAQILIVLAMLFGLCATSFYLGRWIERDRWNETTARTSAAPKVVDSGAGDLTFFDTLGKGTAEPTRQARAGVSPAPSGAGRSPAAPAGSTDAAEGSDVEPSTPARSPSPSAGGGAAAAPAPAAPGPARGAPAAGSGAAAGGYAVQVFAGDRSQAERIASSLTHKGFTARVVAGSSAGTARVRVVGYRSKADATAAAARLKREANLKPWVLKAD